MSVGLQTVSKQGQQRKNASTTLTLYSPGKTEREILQQRTCCTGGVAGSLALSCHTPEFLEMVCRHMQSDN